MDFSTISQQASFSDSSDIIEEREIVRSECEATKIAKEAMRVAVEADRIANEAARMAVGALKDIRRAESTSNRSRGPCQIDYTDYFQRSGKLSAGTTLEFRGNIYTGPGYFKNGMFFKQGF